MVFQRISLSFPYYTMCTCCLLKQFLESNAQQWMSVLVSSATYVLPLDHRKEGMRRGQCHLADRAR